MLRAIINLVVSALVLPIIVYFLRMMIGTDPKALARMIDRADQLVVVQDPFEAHTILFESTDRQDFAALKTALAVRLPRERLHCLCLGMERIEFYANGELLGWVSNQHCKNIRFSDGTAMPSFLTRKPSSPGSIKEKFRDQESMWKKKK